jgi:hypothetical protein
MHSSIRAQIAFDANAILNWFNILKQASLQEAGVDRLLDIASNEDPDDERLQRLKANQPVAIIEGRKPEWRARNLSHQRLQRSFAPSARWANQLSRAGTCQGESPRPYRETR